MPRLAASIDESGRMRRGAVGRIVQRTAKVVNSQGDHGDMDSETILFETKGPVGLLSFNRPESLNAFNGRLIDETNDCWTGWRRTIRSALWWWRGQAAPSAPASISRR